MKDKTSYEEIQKVEEKRLDVYPVKKGKRILLYLCDLVIAFFFCFVFYTTLVVPVSQSAVSLTARQEESRAARVERNEVLIENKILHREYLSQELNDEMYYTAKEYAKYYVGLTSIEKPDVFRTFYYDVRSGSEDKYVKAFADCNSQGFFEMDLTTKVITLKEPYKTSFHDGLSDKFTPAGEAEYNRYYNSYFLGMYGTILNDIRTNDLKSTATLRSYMTCQNVINSYESFFKKLVAFDTFISFALGISVCYILIPLVNKNHKTASMFFMRLDKVNVNNLELKSKGSIFIELIYHISTHLFLTFIIPLSSVGFNAIFDVPIILPVSLISFGFVLISLIFLLFDEYNRPLSQRFNNTVMINEDTLDEIYKARGYDV